MKRIDKHSETRQRFQDLCKTEARKVEGKQVLLKLNIVALINSFNFWH